MTYPITRMSVLGGLAATLSLVASGCGSKAPAADAPAGLGYQTNSAVYRLGTAIAANVPHSTGGDVESYSVAPALPAGLILDHGTGIISGTPAAIAPQANYTVTAANTGGAATAVLSITVTDVPPSALTYGMPQGSFTKGVAIPANAPTSSGGAVTGYSVAPALPAGIVIDSVTGVISGTPTALAARFAYTVTASNSGGSTFAKVEITVKDVAPGALSYGANPATYYLASPIAPNLPTSAGAVVTSYTVAPPLPAGLQLNSATGAITGTPLAPAQGTFHVTASNSGGSAGCDLDLTIIARPPANLTYAANPVIATRGLAMTPDHPANTGGAIIAYGVAPALPAGLSLDPDTGIISGTPAAITPTATYVVTGTNSGGSTNVNLVLSVQDQAPSALAYATNPSAYTVNTAIQPNAPVNSGGVITSYSVSPDLPAGLSLNPLTGVISGTPTAITAEATYVVTGSNATASTTCNFVTSVTGQAISAPDMPVVTTATYATAGKAGYHASTQDQGTDHGMSYQWTITNGSITAGQGTIAVTFTAGGAGPLDVQVKATNLGGSATGSAPVSVEAAPAARIFAQDRVLAGSTAVLASVAPQARMTWQWSLSGDSAGALASGTTNVATYSAGAAPGNYQLSVIVQNLAGDTASDSRTLSVVTNTFLSDPHTAPQRRDHSMTTLLDGRLLVAGGQDGNNVTASALIYDSYSSTWAPVGSLAVARTRHTATLLPDGRVLVAGGEGNDGLLTPVRSAEIFDPATRAWTRVSDMTTERQDHSATLLKDGTVLVAGGVPILTDSNFAFLDSAEVYDPAIDLWTLVGSMTRQRATHTSTLLPDGRVVLVGGYSQQGSPGWERSIDFYNPVTQEWTAGTNMPASRYGHTADLLANGKVLVAGGNASASPSSAVLLDPTKNGGLGSWTAVPTPMANGRYYHRSVALPNGKVLIVAGRDGFVSAKDVATAELYDPAANGWSAGGTLNYATDAHAVALLPDGKVFAFGGVGGGSSGFVSSNAQIYDPAQNLWTNAAGMSWPRYSLTTTVLSDGTLLAAGGTGITGSLAAVESFDPSTGGWSVAGSMITNRALHRANLLGNGKVLITGGWGSASGGYQASVELYTPATKTWAAGPDMPAAHGDHSSTMLADGRVLVAGGWLTASATGASAAIYDPSSNAWTAVPDMSGPRSGHQAVLLANGKVLVFGGRNDNSILGSAELFDPATNTWTPAAPMNSPRQFHRATLLQNGRVLVTGGAISGSIFTGTAEIYDPAADAWTIAAPMNRVRADHSLTVLPDHTILAAGGHTASTGAAVKTAERYDPVSNTWTPVGDLLMPRFNHTATAIGSDGTVLIVGGNANAMPEVWKP